MGINLIAYDHNPEEDVRNRSRIEVIAGILQAVNDGGCSLKNQIMYKAFLSFAQTRKYVEDLTDSGLLMYDLTAQTYEITENGRGFLQIYDEINGLMNLAQLSDLGQYQAWIEEEVDQRIATAKRN